MFWNQNLRINSLFEKQEGYMKPFKFKQFEIIQKKNPQKIGTDSMLLGAWSAELNYSGIDRILDIGTGTGILALMMAQSFPEADITAIEPVDESLAEASINFKNSPFSQRILPIRSTLQSFGSMEKFDLIISNPPYYDGTYKSESELRNQARHTENLAVHELYECVEDLLSENGRFNVVVPQTEVTHHLERAFDQDLYLQEILHTVKENGERKRALLSFGFEEVDPEESELLVKFENGNYSEEYIELTKEFYHTDLRTLQK